MNIEQIQKTENQNNDTNANKDVNVKDNVKNQPATAESKTFKQEMSAKQVSVDLLNLGIDELCNGDQSKDDAASKSADPTTKISPALMRSIQQFALKNNIPFRVKDINDIKLLMQSQRIFSKHEEKLPSLKLDKIEKNDIDFIKSCAENPNMQLNMINPQTMTVNYTLNNNIETKTTANEVSYKSLNVSKSLANMIDYAYKTQKPVRLDFDGNASVILKIDTEGKLTAEFISSDKAMENLMKNNIPHLRNKMDSEGLPYKEITYREHSSKNSRNYQQEDNSYE